MTRVTAIVRESQDADMPKLQAIYAHHVETGTASWEWEPPTLDDMIRRRQALLAGNFPYLVLEGAGDPLGFAYAGPFRLRRGYRYTVEDSIYMAPDCHGQGLGKVLLSALIERATALGFRQMVAIIGDSANEASIALHRAEGFRDCGRMISTGFKFDQWLDTVIMQRALGEGDRTKPGPGSD